jgi:hypothetical protein
VDDVVTAAGPGGGPHVRVFSIGADGTASQISSPLGSFMAFDPTFGGGVNVAAGNVNGNTVDGDELVVAAGPGGGPHVRVLDAIGNEVAGFMAFDPTFNGGVSIGAITANQLLVDSLSGGGVTQFMLGPGGAITPFVITPINISAAATALGLLGVDPALVNGFTPLTSDFAFGPNGPVLLNQITGLPIGIDPFFTSLGTIGTDAALLGTPTTSLAPNFNNVNLNTVTPAQVAALNGAIFPGLDLMTTNPLVANLALPPV